MSAHALAALPSIIFCAALLVAAALLALMPGSRIVACALAGFASTAAAADVALAHRLPAALDGRDFAVTGWIDDFPDIKEQSTTFSLRVETVADGALPLERLRLTWYDDAPDLGPGMALDLIARLRAPRGLSNPGGFDYERWLFVERYGATGYVRRGSVLAARADSWAAGWLARRGAMARELTAAARTPESGALLAAITIGDRSGFSEQQWADFRRTGTSHLVAISGLHIGLVASVCFWLAGALARRSGHVAAAFDVEVAATAAALSAFAYAGLAGFSLPTQRAVVMCLFALMVLASRRYTSRLNGIAAALVAVLVLDPLATLTASFWMSFTAVAALLAVAGGASTARGSRQCPPWRRWAHELLRTQCLLTAALAPLAIGFFAEVSLLALLVNLLAIPFFCFVLVPATLAAAIAGSMAPALWPATQALSGLADASLATLHWFAQWRWAAFETPGSGIGLIVLAAGGAFLALPWHECPGRRLGWLALLPMFWPQSPGPAQGDVRLVLLDVGHGLAAIVETRSHRLLYDAGPVSQSGFDTGLEVVVPALRSRPRIGLDTVIVSHSDNDHIGGAAAVLGAYPAAEVLYGPDVSTLAGTACRAGQQWTWDDVEFRIVHPSAAFDAPGNDSSCVLKITAAQGSMLLTGDIEARGERALQLRRDLDVDVVVVPHHGSATSSSAAFVAELAPAVALVSAGYHNRWGFPRPEVVARWHLAGTRVYVTGELGALYVSWRKGRLEVESERQSRPRYWQAANARIPG